MEATTKDLRLRTKALIAATDRGEEVIITYRGVQRARLVPLQDQSAMAGAGQSKNPAFGLWQGRTDLYSVDEEIRALRRHGSLHRSDACNSQ